MPARTPENLFVTHLWRLLKKHVGDMNVTEDHRVVTTRENAVFLMDLVNGSKHAAKEKEMINDCGLHLIALTV